jgi:tungstate transport system substrate-binding protein
MMITRRLLIASAAIALCAAPALAQDKSITVASTTSTQDSGLFGHLLPLFKQKTGIDVKVVSQGTGQALDTARRGDADVVFVHARSLEEKFVAEGFGVKRFPVMYNDFILIGPKQDPAGVKGAWYREIGQGMGAALNTSSSMGAYVLTDRGTWLSFKNRGDLQIVVEGDTRLFNQYGVILVDPTKHTHVKKAEGQAFIDWLVSPEGQKAIADYKVGGEQLFFPNATAQGV